MNTKISELSETAELGYPIQVAITGIAGSGKTELVKYYNYHASKSSIRWIILADTPENLWRSYLQLAIELKIETARLNEEDEQGWHERICRRVNDSLSEKPWWILIFDNVDKLCDISTFLPKRVDKPLQGKILITTKNSKLLGDNDSMSISSGLNPDEATQLLEKITKLPTDQNAVDLAKTLDYLPLYLLISATAIRNAKSGDPRTYEEYNNHIQSYAEDIEEEHKLYVGQLEYNKTQHAVIRAAINQLDENSRKLLTFCGYLSPMGITMELLKSFIRIQDNTASDNKVALKCKQSLLRIQESSLLQEVPNQPIYNIHRITQQIIREARISEDQANNIIDAVMDNTKSEEMGKLILSHMSLLANNKELLMKVDKFKEGKLLRRCGMLHYYSHNYTQAEGYLIRAVGILKDFKEEQDERDYGVCLFCLGWIFYCEYDYGKAIGYYEKARQIYEKYYDKNSREVYNVLNNSAISYMELPEDENKTKAFNLLTECYNMKDSNGKHPFPDAGFISNLGEFYYNGAGATKDDVKAVELFQEGKSYKDYSAIFDLGWCYEYGIGGLVKSEQEAFELNKEAAKGSIYARCNLVLYYKNGIGVDKDEDKAKEYLDGIISDKKENGLHFINRLGEYYRDGISIHKDEKKAFQLFEVAADFGHVKAMHNLGVCYKNGIGVDKDDTKGDELIQQAVGLGYKPK